MANSIICPECRTDFDNKNINAAENIAHCGSCGKISKLSELVTAQESRHKSIHDFDRPSGVSFENTGRGFRLTATLRSALAFFLVPFSIVWIGGSIGGIYGSQLATGNFNLTQSLFGIPFLIGSVFLGSATLLNLFGRIEIHADQYDGHIFTGVGPFGLKKQFSWKDVSNISEGISTIKVNDRERHNITLEGRKRITFGSGLSEERRYYILQVLQILRSQMT